MIKSIQQETRDAVKGMEEGAQEVDKGEVEAEKSGCALVEILNQINIVNGQVARS